MGETYGHKMSKYGNCQKYYEANSKNTVFTISGLSVDNMFAHREFREIWAQCEQICAQATVVCIRGAVGRTAGTQAPDPPALRGTLFNNCDHKLYILSKN